MAVIEVGIGGMYDSTNIIWLALQLNACFKIFMSSYSNPVVCAVSSLGYDHTDILGDTLEQIAWQKAGICKVGRGHAEQKGRKK